MGRTNEVQARAGISSASRHRLGGSDARSILWNPCASATAVIASHDFGDAALSRLRLQPLLEQRPRGPEAELPLQPGRAVGHHPQVVQVVAGLVPADGLGLARRLEVAL